MIYELLSPADYNDLPDDDKLKFVALEAKCRGRLNEFIDRDESAYIIEPLKSQYIAIVSAIGEECNVSGLSLFNESSELPEFERFMRAVLAQVVRISMRQGTSGNTESVLLIPETKRKIEFQVGRLRETIEKSTLPEEKKARLGASLDQFTRDLHRARLSLGATMSTLVIVAAVMSNVTTIAADGQAAVVAIMKLIGVDKASEDAARLRLEPPLLLIEPPLKAIVPPVADLDD